MFEKFFRAKKREEAGDTTKVKGGMGRREFIAGAAAIGLSTAVSGRAAEAAPRSLEAQTQEVQGIVSAVLSEVTGSLREAIEREGLSDSLQNAKGDIKAFIEAIENVQEDTSSVPEEHKALRSLFEAEEPRAALRFASEVLGVAEAYGELAYFGYPSPFAQVIADARTQLQEIQNSVERS